MTGASGWIHPCRSATKGPCTSSDSEMGDVSPTGCPDNGAANQRRLKGLSRTSCGRWDLVSLIRHLGAPGTRCDWAMGCKLRPLPWLSRAEPTLMADWAVLGVARFHPPRAVVAVAVLKEVRR